ncbi:hypothetical protein TNCV_2109011 [Trichonephila clavipes]|nr:hypothetical protein TNCV_2109011 [Trichonephila clavipes]
MTNRIGSWLVIIESHWLLKSLRKKFKSKGASVRSRPCRLSFPDRFSQFRVWGELPRPSPVLGSQFLLSHVGLRPSLPFILSSFVRPLAVARDRSYFRRAQMQEIRQKFLKK